MGGCGACVCVCVCMCLCLCVSVCARMCVCVPWWDLMSDAQSLLWTGPGGRVNVLLLSSSLLPFSLLSSQALALCLAQFLFVYDRQDKGMRGQERRGRGGEKRKRGEMGRGGEARRPVV